VETGISQLITVAYNAETGVLDLSGKDTRANYQTALTKVSFRSPVSGEAEISDKRIVFTVKDSVDVSNAMSRIVSITEIFPEVSIVDAFTPNDDGVNDVWDFLNLDFYSQVELAIFDRNGTRVFECKTNDCTWDGKMNGKELPPGPYFYTLYLNGGKRKYQGIVTILR
ncbi:MAG TPA: gliding motility-associated C-terminal domain-containing protein, partial [Cyclobacteriaceae bacterium]|nr:gliding motility-associated C-terminal domain-containing protein [Cyclobacteriaceae bacterium]